MLVSDFEADQMVRIESAVRGNVPCLILLQKYGVNANSPDSTTEVVLVCPALRVHYSSRTPLPRHTLAALEEIARGAATPGDLYEISADALP
jgi:hypothetical protein